MLIFANKAMLDIKKNARRIVATGARLGRGLPRDAESLHPRACIGVPSPCELQNLLPNIASGERCESVAEKRSKQRTTVYTRLLAHAKDA